MAVVVSVSVITGLLAAAIIYRQELANVAAIQQYGLLGVFLITLLAASPISVTAIPIPYMVIIFTLPGMLSDTWGFYAPILVGIVAAIGATLGQIPTFTLSYGSSSFSTRILSKISQKLYRKAEALVNKYGAFSVFIVSALPNPVHLPLTVIIGTLKFSPVIWTLLSLSGNAVKCLSFAFAGYYGLTSLERWLGI